MEGHLERDGHKTWYRIVGDLDPDALHAPVVICHGGPGATHHYVAPIAELHRSGRACVLYDQLGNGNSDHLPDADRPSGRRSSSRTSSPRSSTPRDRRALSRDRPVLGRHARDGPRARPPARPALGRRRRLARDADAFARGAVSLLTR